MGNQREIRQVYPTCQLGVAIVLRPGGVTSVQNILNEEELRHFYTQLAPANAPLTIHNMDFDSAELGASPFARFVIVSGGKMWCGYEAFGQHIARVAPYLEDALFFVGDEESYIDRFAIKDGQLTLTRVHEGYWRPVDEYIVEHFLHIDPWQ